MLQMYSEHSTNPDYDPSKDWSQAYHQVKWLASVEQSANDLSTNAESYEDKLPQEHVASIETDSRTQPQRPSQPWKEMPMLVVLKHGGSAELPTKTTLYVKPQNTNTLHDLEVNKWFVQEIPTNPGWDLTCPFKLPNVLQFLEEGFTASGIFARNQNIVPCTLTPKGIPHCSWKHETKSTKVSSLPRL